MEKKRSTSAKKGRKPSGSKKSGKAVKRQKAQVSGGVTIIAVILLIIGIIWLIVDFRRQEAEENVPVNTSVSSELEVHYIDVGQGDSVLIKSGGKTMLIDSGDKGALLDVKRYLMMQEIKRLDYVIATHPHSDHMGCMGDLLKEYEVGEIIMPHLPSKDVPTTKYFTKFLDTVEQKGFTLTEAELGRKIDLGDASCEIVGPFSEKYSDTNNYSVCVLLRHGTKSFIFTGDAEALAEKEMISAGVLADVDVYKAGHHGSDSSSCEEFLSMIKPEFAVISCGKDNSYGHPTPSTIEKFMAHGIEYYRTDEHGSIVITSDGSTLKLETER